MNNGTSKYPLTDVPRSVTARNLHAVETSLGVICGKWKIMIVAHLHDGPLRFSALRKFMPLISQQSLVVQLRELEKDGVVKRHIYMEMTPHVEYSLTDVGHEISPMMLPLMIWGYAILETREAQRASLEDGAADRATGRFSARGSFVGDLEH